MSSLEFWLCAHLSSGAIMVPWITLPSKLLWWCPCCHCSRWGCDGTLAAIALAMAMIAPSLALLLMRLWWCPCWRWPQLELRWCHHWGLDCTPVASSSKVAWITLPSKSKKYNQGNHSTIHKRITSLDLQLSLNQNQENLLLNHKNKSPTYYTNTPVRKHNKKCIIMKIRKVGTGNIS